MTLLQSLKSLTPYPLAASFIETICAENGVDPNAEITPEIGKARAYRLCKARVYQYLAMAPNVTQGGISYSFSADERAYFRKLAVQLFGDEDESIVNGEYGYCGEDL